MAYGDRRYRARTDEALIDEREGAGERHPEPWLASRGARLSRAMTLKQPKGPAGRLVVLQHRSGILKGKPLGFRIPFNAESSEAIEARWKIWRHHDPIHLVSRFKVALISLRGFYIDCGWCDQYPIRYGSRLLPQRLAEAGVAHRYEKFDDDHSDIGYRMDVSMAFLTRVML